MKMQPELPNVGAPTRSSKRPRYSTTIKRKHSTASSKRTCAISMESPSRSVSMFAAAARSSTASSAAYGSVREKSRSEDGLRGAAAAASTTAARWSDCGRAQ